MNRLPPYLEKKLEELEAAYRALPFEAALWVSVGRKADGDFPKGFLVEITPTYFVLEQNDGAGSVPIERTDVVGITWEERRATQLRFALQLA